MLDFLRGAAVPARLRVPLFPLKTVLFPGGRLPLRIFEQRYIEMAKACIRDDLPFGVVLIERGEEVAIAGAAGSLPDFVSIGTLATIRSWDMPQGLLHVTTAGGARFEVRSHAAEPNGLFIGDVAPIAPEPSAPVGDADRPLADLLQMLATRIGPQNFPDERAWDDASWVGYRLAEILPLPLSVKQKMLEVNDARVRLTALKTFLQQHRLL